MSTSGGRTQQARRARPVLAVARWLPVAFFAVVCCYAVAVHLAAPVLPYDDAFIIYRYADNLVSGNGLVYNPGERVFGASTPLFTAWMAAAKAVARPVPTPDLAVRLNALFYLATGIGLLALLRRILKPPWLAPLVAGLLMLRDGLLYSSVGGMESFLFTALVFWACWALVARRPVLSGLFAGLSVMTRPEGVLLGLVVAAGWLVSSRRRPVAFFAALAAPTLLWVGFSLPYYGTPVYHSLIAKAAPLYPLAPGVALRDTWQELRLWTTAGLLGRSALVTAGLAAVAIVGHVLSFRVRGVDRPGAYYLPALLAGLLLFYFLTNPMMMAWYYPAVVVVWLAVIATGLGRLASWFEPRSAPLRWLAIGLLLALLGYPAISPVAGRLRSGRDLLATGSGPEVAVRLRTEAYRAAAEWLNDVLPADVRVAAPEIGSFGYYYRGPVTDACGLVSPEVVPYLPVPDEERLNPKSGAIGVEMTQALDPEVIVTMATFAVRSLYESDWFAETYGLVRRFPLPREVWGSTAVDVFIRRDRLGVE